MRLPGLVRICEGLESQALTRLGTTTTHLIEAQDITILQRQMGTLLGAIASLRKNVAERRTEEYPSKSQDIE